MRPPVLPSGNAQTEMSISRRAVSRFNEAAGFTQRKRMSERQFTTEQIALQ